MKHILVIIALALAACGGHLSGVMKAPGDARVGDRTHCPVTGEEFVVTASSPKAEYNGKTYYFCCDECDGKFKANPQKFVHDAR